MKTWTNGELVQDTDLNNNFSEAKFLIDPLTAGEAISNSTSPRALYVKASDGKAYKTNAGSDGETVTAFLGFSTATASINNPVNIQKRGLVSGFSGLTIGSRYYLAKAAASAATQTGGTDGTGSDNTTVIGGTNSGEYTRAFTISDLGIFKSYTQKIYKVGSPTGNLFCKLYTGGVTTGNGTLPQGTLIASLSVAASSVSTSGTSVLFDFTDMKLPAGTYHLEITHDTPNISNYFQVQSTTTSGTVYTHSGSNVNGTQANGPYTITFDGSTFVAGDITTWFYDFAKSVGIAVSATELQIDQQKTMSSWVTLSVVSGTAYVATADRDGFILYIGSTNSGNTCSVETPVGSLRSKATTDSGPTPSSPLMVPVRAGDMYRISYTQGSGGTASIWFVPLN